jgi:hypothetical protein
LPPICQALAVVALVELVGVAVNVPRRRRRQPDVEGVEERQRRLPRPINRAVAFVRDHDVKIPARKLAVAADHRLQQADGDLLLLHGHARLQPIAAVLRAEVLQRGDGLLRQLLPIHQEQQPLGPVRLEHPLRLQADDVRLARAGGQFHQEPPLAQFHRHVHRPHQILLVRPRDADRAGPQEVLGNDDGRQWLPLFPQVHQPFQVAPGEDSADDPGVVVFVVPEVGDVAVRQENERRPHALR